MYLGYEWCRYNFQDLWHEVEEPWSYFKCFFRAIVLKEETRRNRWQGSLAKNTDWMHMISHKEKWRRTWDNELSQNKNSTLTQFFQNHMTHFFFCPPYITVHIRWDSFESLKTTEIQETYCPGEHWVCGVNTGNTIQKSRWCMFNIKYLLSIRSDQMYFSAADISFYHIW